MKRLFITWILLLMVCPLIIAQQETLEKKSKVKTTIGVDFMSRYVWRGLDYGTGASAQPWTNTTFGAFNLSSWGAFSADGDYAEIVLKAGVTVRGVKFQIGDTFVHPEEKKDIDYFEYGNDSTRHNLSANLFFGGTPSLPVKFMISTYFHGPDKERDKVTRVKTTKQNFSTYILATYPFGNETTAYEAHLALTPADGVYRQDFGVVDFGLTIKKKIKLSENYKLPVSAAFIANPYDDNFFMVFGFHI